MLFGSRQKRVQDFESATLPHLDDLFRAAVRLIGDRTEAEDVVQDVYLQAWKSFHRFEAGTNCRAWLFKILFHVIHHHRRKWFQVKILKEREDVLDEALTSEPPIPEHLSDDEVLVAFQKIPQQYREVVLLADVQEFSYKEIATMFNIPVGTVMSRLSRGRALLRVELAEYAKSHGIKHTGGEDQGACM